MQLVLPKLLRKILLLGLNNPPSAEIKHTITVQLQHASTMCKDAKIRHAVTAVDVTGNATEAIINYAQDKDINHCRYARRRR